MKGGIDWFPLDVQMDAKLRLIEAEFGCTGFGVVVHVLQEIYGGEGYYIEWTEEVALLFAQRYGLGGSVVSEIIAASLRRGMFDQELYQKYRVLTSHGIQTRYFQAVSRRKSLEVMEDILLVPVAQICKNADIKRKNVDVSLENVSRPKQSRVEESRGEKSRAEDRRVVAPAAPPPPSESASPSGGSGRRPIGASPLGGSGRRAEGGNSELRIPNSELNFPSPLKEAMADWLAYKKEKRQSYTPTGLKTLMNTAERYRRQYGAEAVAECIRLAISSNYTGIPWDRLGKSIRPSRSPDPVPAAQVDMEKLKELLNDI